MRDVGRPTAADFEQAWRVVREWLPPTPLLRGTDGSPALKLETFQPTGAFKVRGALAAMARLDSAVPIVTASAGNHGAGVACAASLLGHEVTVVTATTASPAKVEAIKKYDVRLLQTGTTYDDGHVPPCGVTGRVWVFAVAGWLSNYDAISAGCATSFATLSADSGGGVLS